MSWHKLAWAFAFVVAGGAGPALAIPCPAYVFCLEMGYEIEGDYCVFPDGSSCELWAFFWGECGEEYVHPVPCAEAGEHRGVAVECCEGLDEISTAYPEQYSCVLLLGAFPLCSDCGDGVCDEWESVCNCPEDCGDCVEEGETIPVIPDPPACCLGLELIPPMSPDQWGIFGYCTASCGDGVCDPEIETGYNCPADCPCVDEGGTIPVIPDPPVCCYGLTLIPPMSPDQWGIYGYCTANCGDGVCDPDIETGYNCPADCPCVDEGGTIPVIPDPPVCCYGLTLIPPMSPHQWGIYGYCTANCGDGVCDPDIETSYNCPQDCQRTPVRMIEPTIQRYSRAP
ncbi:MAG: hypothetical protein JSV78_07640 [Phycisphaerales bacterium]|nr:MAG: hypothetical protein JSV78_07640 [Phycisphaerales bacterium]